MNTGPSRPRPQRQVAPDWVQRGLLFFGVLAFIAFVVDLCRLPTGHPQSAPTVNEELQTVLLDMGKRRYTDSNGLFSVAAPAGWRILRPPQSDFYNVIFKSPNGADISILVNPVQYDDLPSLFKEIESNENESGIHPEVSTIRLKDRQAIRRTCKLLSSRVLAIDFVANHRSHHILCTAPIAFYEKYEPVFMEIIETYEPKEAGGTSNARAEKP